MATGASATDGLAKVTLKLEKADDPDFPAVHEVMVPPGTSVYNMLLEAAHSGFITFTATWSGKFWSHLIVSINGYSNDADLYWFFEDQGGNPFNRGVDLISVYDGDTIVFRYGNMPPPPKKK